jgi:tryptophanyl-tRNA synthetase
MTQFKEKSDQYGQNAGLFTYPILMAADVALYQAELVPAGDDQIQHLELAREIIRSFNAHAGKVFNEPQPLLTSGSRIMSLKDPTKKMSKSVAGSAIGLLDDEATIIKTIRRAVTDSDPNAATPSKALQNLFAILEVVAGPEAVENMEAMRQDGKLRYSELKELLIEETLNFLRPIQKAYRSLIRDPKALEGLALNGSKRARAIAKENLSIAKKALGLVG